MINRRQTTTESESVSSWVKTDSYSTATTAPISPISAGSDPFQKRVLVSGSTSKSVSISYNTASERTRRDNLLANGKIPRSTPTSSDGE